MAEIWQDVRYGFRMLARKPSFATLAILTLALGIGGTTAIFSVVNAVLLSPLPFKNPGRLVQLFQTEPSPGNFPMTGQDYLDWRAQNHTFEDMAVFDFARSFNASGSGEPERVTGVATQSNFFSLLGVQPAYGRLFLPGDTEALRNRETLLSHGFWKRHFGGQSNVVGTTIDLNGESYRIVGVMPAWFRLPATADLWIPIDMTPGELGGRGSHHLRALGRVKDGVTIEQARADLLTISTNLEKQFPDSNYKVHSVVVLLTEQLIGASRTQLWTLFGAVALVLLIACVNVANLLLARATDRRREIAMRAALGAERPRLIRQLLTESVLLATLGALPGIGLAYLSVSLIASSRQFTLPQPNPITVNVTVLAFALLLSVAVGILFGLAPAVQISRISLVDELKSCGKMMHGGSGRSGLMRNALVTAEIALSLALLAGAGLLFRTFANLEAVSIGVDKDHALTAAVQLPQRKYPTDEQVQRFHGQLLESLASAPGIQTAALTTELPLQGGTNGYIQIDGRSDQSIGGQLVEATSVTPEYFRALGIPIIRGRGFTNADMQETARIMRRQNDAEPGSQTPPSDLQAVAVINQTMAQHFWPNEEPTTKYFRRNGIRFRIIGVVGDTKIFALRQKPMPQAYYPLVPGNSYGGRTFRVVVRTAEQPRVAAATIRSTVKSLDSSLAVYYVLTMDEIQAATMAYDTQQTFLLGIFAALALTLAAVGTYSVMSYLVTQRTGEIGIRITLGAGTGSVLWLIIRQGLALAVLGVAIGLGGALAASRLLESSLFGVKPNDPATLAAVSAVMILVAILACLVPALRATRIEPISALRLD